MLQVACLLIHYFGVVIRTGPTLCGQSLFPFLMIEATGKLYRPADFVGQVWFPFHRDGGSIHRASAHPIL